MKAVFLDRDGVINEDRDDYVKGVHELKVFPYVPQSIRRLNEAGQQVFVVSNQQGVAKGLFSEENLVEMQKEINKQVEIAGGKISGFYFCTHLASDECSCRKPKSGLLTKAAREHGIDLTKSIMVGDSERDLIAGKSVGCVSVLVLTGKLTRRDVEFIPCRPDYVAQTLSDAVDYIIELMRE